MMNGLTLDRIDAAHAAAYAASNAARNAASAYGQAAGAAVSMGDWKLVAEMASKQSKMAEMADKIYATMIAD